MNQVQKIEPAETLPEVQQATTILQVIAAAAQNPDVDTDKMERLLEMHERIVARQAKTEFDAALALMQPKLPVIDKKGKIEVRKKDSRGERTGEIQQSTAYAKWEDINEAILPILSAHGFALSFRTGMTTDGKVTVTGILSHSGGHREETIVTLMHDSTGSKNSVQAVGSSYSYGKRYAATALLNFTTRGEDDDGNAAGEPTTINEEQMAELDRLFDETGANVDKFCAYFQIEFVRDLPAAKFEAAKAMLAEKKAKANAGAR